MTNKPRQHIKKQRHYFANKSLWAAIYIYIYTHISIYIYMEIYIYIPGNVRRRSLMGNVVQLNHFGLKGNKAQKWSEYYSCFRKEGTETTLAESPCGHGELWL